ncbi:MAG: hypothetical protein IB618_00880 [Candidatus Pacearchaeota archaeon]|nr:MAG: hypothetical protein IB618_00880 [Candidatus Pacearchaeota archaeon]
MNVWDRIIDASKLPNISDFSTVYDMNENEEMEIKESGKPTLEQTVEILHLVAVLDSESAIILPNGFTYRVDARTVRKNVRPIMLKRIRTKREAIEQEITPSKLAREKIEKMRFRYQIKPETLREDYAGINFVGITDKKIKNYLISDAIEGYLHAKNASSLIEIQRWDTLESLLKERKYQERLSFQEKLALKRVTMRKEILKMGSRKKTLTEVPEKPRRIILTREAVRVAKKVPSTSERGKFYKEIRFRRLPEVFPDNEYPELNKEFYAAWTDFWIEPPCTCQDKTWFISYIRPNQVWYCIHEIAAFRKALSMDWQEGRPVTYPDPYIATSPFLRLSQDYINYYMKWKKQVFIKKRNSYQHLAKVYLDIWPEKQVRRGKIELL